MVYLRHEQKCQEFADEESAMMEIERMMTHALLHRVVYDETDKNGVRVIVYQWWTLRTDVFILCDKPDMRQSV